MLYLLVTNMLEKSVGMFWSDTRGKRVSCVDMEIWKIRKELVWVSQQQEMQVKEHAARCCAVCRKSVIHKQQGQGKVWDPRTRDH